ncbi:30S ribosomal protein S6 [Candidatus Margulisiibacteriota bacterium]
MGNYEMMFVIDASVNEEKIDELIGVAEKIIQDAKGVVFGSQKVGRKSIPTTFKKHKNVNIGYYVLTTFQVEENKIKDIDRKIKLKDIFVLYIIVKQKVKAKEETATA